MGTGRAGWVAGLVALLCGLALPCGPASAAQLQQFPGVDGVPVVAGHSGTVALLTAAVFGDVKATTISPDGSTRVLPVDSSSRYVTITFGPDGNYWASSSG